MEEEWEENTEAVSEISSSASSAASAPFLQRYRAALGRIIHVSENPPLLQGPDLYLPFAGWIYVANDTWQQFHPSGFLHRYECGFTTLPEARIRNFFTHNLNIRWLLTVPVKDVIEANRAALKTLVAAGACILPGRIKWFYFPQRGVAAESTFKVAASKKRKFDSAAAVDADADPAEPADIPPATGTPLVTCRMILDWIRSSVQPWEDRTRIVRYNAGPAQGIQKELINNYRPDRFGNNQARPGLEPPRIVQADHVVAVLPRRDPNPRSLAVGASSSASAAAAAAARVAAVIDAPRRRLEERAAAALPPNAHMRRYRHHQEYVDDDEAVHESKEEEEEAEERKSDDEEEEEEEEDAQQMDTNND